MTQLILQPFFRLSYISGFSLTSPDEPPMGGQSGTYLRQTIGVVGSTVDEEHSVFV